MAKKLLYNYVFTPGAAGAGTVVVTGKISLRKLLLITNVTTGEIIYNFADTSKNATVSYNSTTNETTFTLEVSTSGMLATHDLQIFYDESSVEISPDLTYQDPVEKMRVSTPQAMMDTDFEYSLQATKWEAIGLVNNLPSVFVAANEPAFTSEQVNYIRPVGLSSGGGGAGTGTFQTLASAPADRTSTGLTTRFGSYASTIGTDEASVSITFPWNVNFLGTNYSFGHINANGWFGFGTTSSGGFAGTNLNPSTPTLHFVSVPNSSTDNNLSFVGTETYTDATFGTCFRIRYHGANIYSASRTDHRVDLIFPQSQPSLIIICHRTFVTDNNNEQMGASTGSSWVSLVRHNLGYNFNTNPNWTFISASAGAAQYAIEVNFTTAHSRSVGNPISVRESAAASIDGAYLVAEVTNSTTLRYLPKSSDSAITIENKTGTYSQSGTQITVTSSGHGYIIGDKVYLDFTSGSSTDGTFEVVESPAPTATQFTVVSTNSVTTSGNVTLFKNYKTPYTAVYTGGFYSNSNIPITSVTNVNGTNRAQINFSAPHGLFYKSPFYIVDSTAATALWTGAFTVDQVVSETAIQYETRSGTLFANSNTISSANTIVYAKADSSPIHRAADGGVSINVGNNSPNAQFIRQTRKYFRYQSGKGVQFSSGVLFRPSYDINNISVDTSTIGSNYITLTIETELEHGFSVPPGVGGPSIRLSGFTVTTGVNVYNATTTVFSILDNKKFTCRINTATAPTDLAPGGLRKVEALGWFDATVRSGLFDEQNGIFFEFNGKELFMVRRSSTQQLPGTATILTNSNFLYGTKTKFLSTLAQGDYIVINGQSYAVNNIFSDTKLSISPKYRPSNSATNVKILKTEELRIRQKDFSLDQLDGTGPSGYTLDLNRMQMIFIDYSWYGAGKVRYGIRTNNGDVNYFHETPNNNVNTEAYMRSGNLPGRFEIQNRSNRARITDTLEVLTAFTSSVAAGSDVVTITVSGGHGLQIGDTVLIDFSSTLSDGIYEVLSTSYSSTQFQIRLNTSVKDAATPTGNIRRAFTASTAASFTFSVDDASQFPVSGTIMVNNEYMSYSKVSNNGTYSQTGNVITISNVGSTNGIAQGQKVTLQFTSGTSVNEVYTVTSVTSNSFTVSSYYAVVSSGNVTVYNDRRLTVTTRNLYGKSILVNASKDETVYSINQNCSPSLSHWGVSVIMDGRFDEDKSYLFTAANRGNINFNSTTQEKPLVAIRLAPSADYGIPRDWGVRSLVNRSALTLKRVGAYTRGTAYLITLKINPTSSAFETPSNWLSVGNGSLAQYMDFSQGSLPFVAVSGGDPVFSFFAEEGSGKFAVTDKEIDFIRELGNSILGGSRQYPDGPDILVIYAQPLSSVANNADVRARFSWTESQG
ncbi:MAG: hypothetical protein ACO24P_00010 [Candidatus Nanopelagicaceae bacterium]